MPAVLTSTTPGLALLSLAAWCHALDALRRLDLHGGEHRQHPADCLAGAAAQAVTPCSDPMQAA